MDDTNRAMEKQRIMRHKKLRLSKLTALKQPVKMTADIK